MRFKFDPNATYAGRLLRVSRRPIENRDERVILLRLEFLIFRINETWLQTKGQIACRDVVLAPDLQEDSGIHRLADPLKVTPALSVRAWLNAPGRRPWMTIRFGDPSATDQRQPFVEIRGFDPAAAGLEIRELPHETDVRWATVQAAATELDISPNTARRLIDSHEAEFGESLVRRTAGGHRRINLLLLRVLVSNSS
jgi:hypothetical protein